MLALKCLWGAILGAIGGFVVFLVGFIAIWIVVGILTWNSDTGATWGVMISILAIPIGIVIGIVQPIRKAQEMQKQEDERLRQQAKQEQERQKQEQEMQKQEEERLRQQAKRECKSLSKMLSDSQSTFLRLPQLVSAAESHLDKAEREFSEGAFAPFWDEVEHATNELGAYHHGITEINTNAKDYSSRRSQLKVSIPEFTVPEQGFPDARPVATRLSKIVRKGQRDFQFATIYEQRKTNQLLYAGFGTLAAGINQMQYEITNALKRLSNSLEIKLDDLVLSSDAQADLLSTLTDNVVSGAEAQRKFEKDSSDEGKKQSEMLDNIQRDRKPFP